MRSARRWSARSRPLCSFNRRSRAASTTPRERFDAAGTCGPPAGSTPRASQNRRHSSSWPPETGGTVTRWTRSGGRSAAHVPSTAGRSSARNHQPRRVSARSRKRAKDQRRPCLSDSCQAEASAPAGSRAVRTTWTSRVPTPAPRVPWAPARSAQRSAHRCGRSGREDLVGDDHGPRGGVDRVDQPVPRADGVTGGASPVLLQQVEGGEEVGLGARHEPAGGGHLEPVARQRAGVGGQPRLEVRRARLGGPDVEVHPLSTHGGESRTRPRGQRERDCPESPRGPGSRRYLAAEAD